MTDEILYTPQEVADRLKVSEQTIKLWLREGTLRGVRLGGKRIWRIPESAIQEFLDKD